MRALIISGGTIDRDFALSFIREYRPEYCVAADRGLAFCEEADLRPDYIVGDFDSLPAGRLERYLSGHGVPVRAFNPVKDATDTEIALRQALGAGAGQIVLLGVTGGRMDHFMAALQCLHIPLEAGIPALIVDPCNRISLHDRDFTVKKEEQFGTFVSFFPAGEAVENLTLEGFKYPLRNHHMTNADSLGVSNEIQEDTARVSFTAGRLYMVQSRDRKNN